ncbi:uncharacterized protein PG998_005100 [Apiospora kogelbergensis]|uniref:uncharacterized protein n=1 Tax=Apiospora kogelbergensis TaxID=1337665 RepID=UPI0031320094
MSAPSLDYVSFNLSAPLEYSATSRKRPRSPTDISSDAMVIDDDENDGYQNSLSRAVDGGSREVPDDDAATLYHDGSDDDTDDDMSSSSDDELAQPVQRKLLPTAISTRESDATEDQTRQNLYKAIYDHQNASVMIESLNEKLMDCKDPARMERIGAKLHRLDSQRRAYRDIIENVLAAEDRKSAQSRFTAVERYSSHHAAHYHQRGSRSSQPKSRIDGMLEEEEKSHRMSRLLDAAKQAARKGAKRLKLSLADEARKNREWSAKKRREREAQKYAYRGRRK